MCPPVCMEKKPCSGEFAFYGTAGNVENTHTLWTGPREPTQMGLNPASFAVFHFMSQTIPSSLAKGREGLKRKGSYCLSSIMEKLEVPILSNKVRVLGVLLYRNSLLFFGINLLIGNRAIYLGKFLTQSTSYNKKFHPNIFMTFLISSLLPVEDPLFSY